MLIEEKIHTEIQIDPVIFRKEFLRYQNRYLSYNNQNELIHAYIFLQIYIESFLHNYMRHIIGLEFKPPRDEVVRKWYGKERDKIPVKLDSFVSEFFSTIPVDIEKNVSTIKSQFKKISDIRNMFAHGHKVSMGMNTDGTGFISPAGLKLAPWELKQALIDTNELGKAWNDLLNGILPYCKSLRTIKDFKFKLMKTKSIYDIQRPKL